MKLYLEANVIETIKVGSGEEVGSAVRVAERRVYL